MAATGRDERQIVARNKAMTCSPMSDQNAFATAGSGLASIFHPVLHGQPEILQSRPGRTAWKHPKCSARTL